MEGCSKSMAEYEATIADREPTLQMPITNLILSGDSVLEMH